MTEITMQELAQHTVQSLGLNITPEDAVKMGEHIRDTASPNYKIESMFRSHDGPSYVNVVFGPSESGKTVGALELAATITRYASNRTRRVRLTGPLRFTENLTPLLAMLSRGGFDVRF